MIPSTRDQQRLVGTHPKLIELVTAVMAKLQDQNFTIFVIEGLRTVDAEKANVADGKSQTMDSRHLFGLAVDLGIMIDGELTWDAKAYATLSALMLSTAADLQIPIIWGGSWKTLKDYDHWELNRVFYPDPKPPTTT